MFKGSNTPFALYARQKWLGEEGQEDWEKDFKTTLEAIIKEQLENGSWDNNILSTIRHLFGLHLTIRKTDARVEKGLQWLLNKIIPSFSFPSGITRLPPIGPQEIYGLPFTSDHPGRLFTAATLFLFSVFNKGEDPLIVDWYERACRKIIEGQGIYFSQPSTHNILRALAVHPKFAQSPASEMITDRLSSLQTSAGDWPPPFPFYQTVNILAHLSFPAAERQLQKALPLLEKKQNKNGSWGRTQNEWNTFLAVHALKRKFNEWKN